MFVSKFMKKMEKLKLTTILCACTCIGLGTADQLVMTTDCFCLGFEFAYFNCSVTNGLFTVWRGSAFSSGCEITISHSEFNAGTAVGSCNSRAIIARGISSINGVHTSQLSIRPSLSLQGESIQCIVNNNNVDVEIGSIILSFTQEAPPAPSHILVSVSDFGELSFQWSVLNLTCPAFGYNTTVTDNCGNCTTNYDSAITTCTNYTKMDSMNLCRFAVQSIICGNITGIPSISETNINLQVPSSPLVSAVPYYLDGTRPILLRVEITFPAMSQIEISDDVNGAVMFYTFNIIDSLSNKMCYSANASCNLTMCSHIIDTSLSSCSPSTDLILMVIATNAVGQGAPSKPIIIAGENSFVSVKFDPAMNSIICIYSNQSLETLKYCNVTITHGTDCSEVLHTYNNTSKSSMIITPKIETVPGVSEYCYSICASRDGGKIVIEGNLNLVVKDVNNVAVAIIIGITVPIIVVPIIIVIIVIIGIIAYRNGKTNNYGTTQPIPVIVKFSNKTEVGGLAEVLNVFDKNGLNIIRMNTHWKKTDLEESYESYHTNYFLFQCTSDEKEELQRRIKFETICSSRQSSSNGKYRFIGKVKVEHRPGALLRKVRVFKNLGIRIDGININRKCEGDYEDNFLSCFCEGEKLRKLVQDLESCDAIKNIKTVFLDPTPREIDLWIMNQSGVQQRVFQTFRDLNICLAGVNSGCDASDDPSKLKFIIECSCNRSKLDELLEELSDPIVGAINAHCLSECTEPSHHVEMGQVPDYCVVEFTVREEIGSFLSVLGVFDKLQIRIIGINTLQENDLHNDRIQERKYLIIQMKISTEHKIERINELKSLLKHYGNVVESEKFEFHSIPSSGEWQSIKLATRYQKMGALIPAVKAFDDLNIYILEINLNLMNTDQGSTIFNVKFKKNRVKFYGTAEEERKIRAKLIDTRLVLLDEDIASDIETCV